MARAYRQISNDAKLWVERDGDSYREPMRFVFHSEDGPRKSADLTDFEIESLIVFLQLVMLERKDKLVLCNRPTLLERYEKMLVKDRETHAAWRGEQAPTCASADEDELELFD